MIGDVVGSRRVADRPAVHVALDDALRDVCAGAIDPPAFTVGDEFQGSYPTVGAAIEWTAHAQRQPGLAMVRTSFRVGDDDRGDADAINAALLCRDHLLGSLDDRSIRIVKGLLTNQTKKHIAAAEGISASAVSQRAGRDGLDLIVVASQYLRGIP